MQKQPALFLHLWSIIQYIIGFPTTNATFLEYSETSIKRTPSIKRTVAEVPKFISLIYF